MASKWGLIKARAALATAEARGRADSERAATAGGAGSERGDVSGAASGGEHASADEGSGGHLWHLLALRHKVAEERKKVDEWQKDPHRALITELALSEGQLGPTLR